MKNLLGGKGANLAEMSSLSLPVPPGFTIHRGLHSLLRQRPALSDALSRQVDAAMTALEQSIGAGFGDVVNPLLVSASAVGRPRLDPGMNGHGAQPRP